MHPDHHDDRPAAAFIAEELAKIPARYSPIAHLSATVGICLAVLLLSVSMIDAFGWREAAVIPAAFLLANLVEWIAHRELLHKERFGFRVLYQQHTPRHHVMYREESMAVASRREWYFVLMPAKGVFGIALAGAPVALALGWLMGADAAWTFMGVVGFYAGSYEVMHLIYHLPHGHAARGTEIIRKLSRHHARHHDPRVMMTKNLNVTFPIFDWIFGTIAPKHHSTEP
ncbi:MAG: sterol desaturase family protein [Patescibacteria group bacterium]|nr:MAG: sterol desaturase family protein [Patescibacteria group bacterium]